MAESTLTLEYNDFASATAAFLGYGRKGWESVADQVEQIDSYIQSGYRNFINAAPLDGVLQTHEWSFMRPVTTITTIASYSTGTVTIVDGVVTLASGTFPSFGTARGELKLTETGASYAVSTRDSSTQLTLTDTTLDADALSEYELSFPTYDLPDDWGSFIGDLTYPPGTSDFYPPVPIVGEGMLRAKRQMAVWTGRPTLAAHRPKTFVATTGQRFELLFDPSPDSAYTLTYKYNANPNRLTATNKYHLGGMRHSECVLESILAVAEARVNDNAGIHAMKFKELLAASIAFDKTQGSPDYLGLNIDRSDGVVLDPHRYPVSLVTYDPV